MEVGLWFQGDWRYFHTVIARWNKIIQLNLIHSDYNRLTKEQRSNYLTMMLAQGFLNFSPGDRGGDFLLRVGDVPKYLWATFGAQIPNLF